MWAVATLQPGLALHAMSAGQCSPGWARFQHFQPLAPGNQPLCKHIHRSDNREPCVPHPSSLKRMVATASESSSSMRHCGRQRGDGKAHLQNGAVRKHVTNVRGRAMRLGQEANQPQSTSRQHIKQGADLADGRQVGACHPLVQPNHQAQHLHKIMFTMQQQSVSQSMSRRGTGFGMKNQTFAL